MNSINDFKKGQKVKMWDTDYKKTVFGEVTSVNTEQETVEIQWYDIVDPCIHNASEFNDIKPA